MTTAQANLLDLMRIVEQVDHAADIEIQLTYYGGSGAFWICSIVYIEEEIDHCQLDDNDDYERVREYIKGLQK